MRFIIDAICLFIFGASTIVIFVFAILSIWDITLPVLLIKVAVTSAAISYVIHLFVKETEE